MFHTLGDSGMTLWLVLPILCLLFSYLVWTFSWVWVCSLYSLEILTGRGGRAILHNGRQTWEEGERRKEGRRERRKEGRGRGKDDKELGKEKWKSHHM